MAPLLDTNHELNWHANVVDAIEQKAANQRTEGGSTTSMHAISAVLPLSGLHCARDDACCAGHCLQPCQGGVTGRMLDNTVCLLDDAACKAGQYSVPAMGMLYL